jgi:cytoskeletal protein CcmA (bactofilin family)
MRNYFIHLFLLFFFVFFLPLTQHVSAAEFFEGETITVPYNKVIEGSIFAGGRSILIQGEVKGDVYCAGKEVIVSGTIGGDLICGGQTIIVEGIVKGNTRVAAQIVDISGSVGHNVTSMGQTVTFQENASVAGEIVTAAQSLRMRGRTEKDLTGWVESSDIRGGVGGNIDLHSESLTIGNTASVGGNLTYVSSSVATIEQNAKILGQTNHTVPSSPPQKNVTNSTLMPHRWNGGAYIIFSLILGGILLFFFKEKIMTHIERIEMQWLQTFGWGIIACISIPILLLLLAITLIGIPFNT